MKSAAMNVVRTALGLVALLALVGCGSASDDTAQPGSGAPAVSQKLNVDNVPEDLRHLVPLAERWGIGDDVDRNAAVDRATPAERDELERAIAPSAARITAWLDSFRQQPMTDEAAAFMYMQLALEEMRAGTP
jgi:hypothetical protein